MPVQIVYPFLGYYESTAGGDVSKVLVTDDTALALVVKTDFTYPLIGSPSAPDPDAIDREVLARAAELLAPYGGWGVVPGAPGPLERGFSSFYNCLPHITDIRRTQRTGTPNPLTGCAGSALYSAENGAIVAPRMAWRYLARELPFQDPSYGPDNPGFSQACLGPHGCAGAAVHGRPPRAAVQSAAGAGDHAVLCQRHGRCRGQRLLLRRQRAVGRPLPRLQLPLRAQLRVHLRQERGGRRRLGGWPPTG